MRWKIRVKDKGGYTHVHRFPCATAAWDHYSLYQSDIDSGLFEWIEMWKKTEKLVATGEQGEEVWTLVHRYK